MFPRVPFRQADAALVAAHPQRADRLYVHLLYLAATTAESEVETARVLLRAAGTVPTVADVQALVQPPQVGEPLAMVAPVLDVPTDDHLVRMGGAACVTDTPV